jgi:hypothetical protein
VTCAEFITSGSSAPTYSTTPIQVTCPVTVLGYQSCSANVLLNKEQLVVVSIDGMVMDVSAFSIYPGIK